VGGERRSFLMTHPPFRGGSRGVGGRGKTYHQSAQTAQVTNKHHGHAGEGWLGEAELGECRKSESILALLPRKSIPVQSPFEVPSW